MWTDETQQSFEELKKALLYVDTLAYPTPGIPCILDTDASDVSVGAVLSQMIDGVENQSLTSPAFSTAHKETTAPRGENFSQL